jgi:hypothetical protein
MKTADLQIREFDITFLYEGNSVIDYDGDFMHDNITLDGIEVSKYADDGQTLLHTVYLSHLGELNEYICATTAEKSEIEQAEDRAYVLYRDNEKNTISAAEHFADAYEYDMER